MLSTPVANSNSPEPTSSRTASRSIDCAGLPTGGHANSRGITDQSFASSTGIAISPTVMCAPWLSAYAHDGAPAGSEISGPMSPFGPTVAL